MRIAIVVDGLESTRQIHADGGHFLRELCAKMTFCGSAASAEVFQDDEVDHLLDGIDVSNFDAVIFASNSLRHAESQVTRATVSHADSIARFLAAGRGLVVLHQFVRGALPLPLPNGLEIAFTDRAQGEFSGISPRLAQDPILNHPKDLSCLNDSWPCVGQLGKLGYWLAMDTRRMEGFTTVASGVESDAVVMRSAEGYPGRVVVSAIPLDWHKATELLENMISYAAAGPPEWILWAGPSSAATTALSSALSQLSAAWVVDHEDDARREWLRSRPTVHVYASPREMARSLEEGGADETIGKGGMFITTEPTTTPGLTNIHAVVGNRSHELAQEYFKALRARDQGWRTSGDLFPLRNVVSAARHFYDLFPDLRYAWDPRSDRELLQRVEGLTYEGMTVTSVLAAAQIHAICCTSQQSRRKFVAKAFPSDVLLSGDRDSQLLLAAAHQLLLPDPHGFEAWLSQVTHRLNDPIEPALAVRILDWLNVLTGALSASGTDATGAIFEQLIGRAGRGQTPGRYVSLEGTANVVLAVATASSKTRDPSFMQRVEPAVTLLRSEYASLHQRPDAHLGQLSRVSQALSCAEQANPLAADRLVSAFPPSLWSPVASLRTSVGAANAHSLSQLAVRNRELSDQVLRMEDEAKRRRGATWTGATVLWLLALVALAGGGVGLMRGLHAVGYESFLAAPLGVLWLGAVYACLRILRHFAIVPPWGVRAVDWLSTRLRHRLAS